MSLKVGDPVTLIDDSISRAGGENTRLDRGLVGRICKITSFAFCNVEFENIGCRRVHKKRLRPTAKQAPQCSSKCSGVI
jgi:hypothetical protein